VTRFDSFVVGFDVSNLTFGATTLKFLKENDIVNIERSCRAGIENGGYSLYGHIEGVAQIKDIIPDSQTKN